MRARSRTARAAWPRTYALGAVEGSTMLIDDILPRHGHRTPAELADDEILSALRGEGVANPDVKRCSADRREVVTLHSSRLFPVRKADSPARETP